MVPGGLSRWMDSSPVEDQGTVGKLREEYFSRLMSCARRTLQRISRRAIDEKNVALSAIVSFAIATEAARRTSAPQLCHARLYWIGRR